MHHILHPSSIKRQYLRRITNKNLEESPRILCLILFVGIRRLPFQDIPDILSLTPTDIASEEIGRRDYFKKWNWERFPEISALGNFPFTIIRYLNSKTMKKTNRSLRCSLSPSDHKFAKKYVVKQNLR